MSKYFTIATGMRCCYSPDNACIVCVDSRKELKAIIENEARYIRDAGLIGANKREVASTVADIWRNLKAKVKSPYSFVVPYGYKKGGYKPYAIQVGHSTRADYLAYIEENS